MYEDVGKLVVGNDRVRYWKRIRAQTFRGGYVAVMRKAFLILSPAFGKVEW